MAKIGITFNETMAGPFMLGMSEPEAAAAAGKQAGQQLAMHAAVTIEDLDGFVADPRHLGGLAGTVDFAPLDSAIPASRGVFNLFSPAGDPDLRHMVYELAFTHGGTAYYLAGHKRVHNDPGFDLWRDTTTLFTTLHEGRDKSAPVVGAGVLSLGLEELMKLVASLRVTGTDDPIDKTAAVAKFGRFFMGELWDRYAPGKSGGGTSGGG
jgi:cholesterol oxidase